MSMAREDKTIWTLGHSNLILEEFISLLDSVSIQAVADIRRLSGSRKYPWYNQTELNFSLQKKGVRYVHFPGLGGRRAPLPDSKNTAWRNKAFMGYADYMETEEFREAIRQLEIMATVERVAYMCAEAVWWRCHRALVSDYLKAHGWKVIHIMGKGKGTEHPYTSPARPYQGELFYIKDDIQ
jgi:uncharacterized protein (DUF488 family)